MKIDQNILNILFSGLIASVLSAIITALINIFYQKRAERKSLSDVLMQLNSFLVNEPFLESDILLEKYLTDDVKENELKKDKYNAYCIMKYNYLETLCRYYSFNKKNIGKELNIKEYLKDNEKWWNNNRKINYQGYDKRFLRLTEEVLNES